MIPPVTLFLFAYNQQDVIAPAVEAALQQTYGDLEIVFSDDCSTDGTFAVISEIVSRYSGNHRIRLNRNEENLGIVAHVNLAFELSSHELIVLAAGDDISLPQRVSRLAEIYWSSELKPLLVHSQATPFIDRPLAHTMSPIATKRKVNNKGIARQKNYYLGPTPALSKEMYNLFGPLKPDGIVEDTALGFRANLLGRAEYISEPLVLYRLGQGASSASNPYQYASFFSVVAEKVRSCLSSQATFLQKLEDLMAVRGHIGTQVFHEMSEELDHQKIRADSDRQSLTRIGFLSQASGARWLAWKKFQPRDYVVLAKVILIYIRRATIFRLKNFK
jgi:glycosyltransferase involved in cell wall biosynthesis